MFPVVKLVTRSVAVSEIGLCSDADVDQGFGKFVTRVVDLVSVCITRLGRDAAWNDDNLDGSNAGRENQSLVITVYHDHDSDGTRRKTPRVLPCINFALTGGIVGILDDDIEHFWFGEVLTKTVRGASLDTATTSWNEALYSGGIKRASELFLLGLDALDHRNSKQFLVDASVEFKDIKNLLVGFRLGQVSRMTFLP